MKVDREKAIKAIEICYEQGHSCPECPLFSEDYCNGKLMHNVLIMLKEQEPVEPIKTKKEIDFRSEIVDAFCCGNCRHELDHCEKWRYCPNCGKAVKWDE